MNRHQGLAVRSLPGLPLVGGDESQNELTDKNIKKSAPRMRGCFRIPGADAEKDCICPLWEGMIL